MFDSHVPKYVSGWKSSGTNRMAPASVMTPRVSRSQEKQLSSSKATSNICKTISQFQITLEIILQTIPVILTKYLTILNVPCKVGILFVLSTAT